jgi:hypothetical protein
VKQQFEQNKFNIFQATKHAISKATGRQCTLEKEEGNDAMPHSAMKYGKY